MVKPVDLPSDRQGLKQMLHTTIEHLNASELSILNRVALRLEAERVADELDAAFDEDRKAGKLTNERIQNIIAEVRKNHPYR